jgi:hypothetical protein
MEGQPPAMEVSYEYIDYAAAATQQGVVLQLVGLATDLQPLTVLRKFIAK